MPRNSELIAKRNQYVLKRFRYFKRRNPKWRTDALIEMVAEEVFLSQVMVARIIRTTSEEKVPHETTIARNKKTAT